MPSSWFQPQWPLDIALYLRLTAVSALVGALVTCVIASLYYLIELGYFVIGVNSDRLEDAPAWLRVVLPIAGCILLIGIVQLFRVDGRNVGVTHVLNRLSNFGGEMPWRNAVTQFLCVAIALITGFSGGRDGPGLHLGAWVGFLIRSRLRLTRAEADLVMRAGLTAAIAAGFNTTFAAVCFVAEVIKTEPISVRTIPPLIAAAAVASVISMWLGVDQLDVGQFSYAFLNVWDWLFVTAFGAPVLLVGIATNRLVIDFTRIRGPLYARFVSVALVTSGLAFVFPETLGLGYDTFVALEHGELEVGVLYLFAFVLIKLLITSISVAFGIPIGVIGPTLVNGAVLGALWYSVMSLVAPDLIAAPVSIYVLLGATALLGTVFSAPLTAVVFFLELTLNPVVTMQVAIMILISHFCKIKLWGSRSIFEERLRAQGIEIRTRSEWI